VAISYTYPGVYVQELPSPVHTITGVATAIAAFVGYTPSGIDNRAQAIFSFADFERLYGGLASDSELSYAVAQFYQNAPGQQAYVVRVPKTPKATTDAAAASVKFDGLTFTSLSSGAWANGNLLIDVDQGPPVDLTVDQQAFNLTITNLLDGTTEYFPNVTLDTGSMNYVATVINDVDNGSQLVNVSGTATSSPLPASGVVGSPITVAGVNQALGGSDRDDRRRQLGLRTHHQQPRSVIGIRPAARDGHGIHQRRADPAEPERPREPAAAGDQHGARRGVRDRRIRPVLGRLDGDR